MDSMLKYGTPLSPGQVRDVMGLEEHVGDIMSWPRHIREAFFNKKGWQHNQRFSLYVFFAGNGLNPELFVDYAIKWKMLNNQTSCDKLCGIIHKHMKGELKANFWHCIDSPHLQRVNPAGVCNPDCPFLTSEWQSHCGCSIFQFLLEGFLGRLAGVRLTGQFAGSLETVVSTGFGSLKVQIKFKISSQRAQKMFKSC